MSAVVCPACGGKLKSPKGRRLPKQQLITNHEASCPRQRKESRK